MIACPCCFKNIGFRSVVQRYAVEPKAVCPQCSTVSPLIDADNLVEAIDVFFVQGSYVAETMAPVYQINRTNTNPAKFDTTLQADAKLASDLTGEVIFDYGPPLWRFGEVNLKYAFDQGGAESEIAASNFVVIAPKVMLPTGTQLFRIRKNVEGDENIALPATFDPPPDHIERSPGRWDDLDSAVLYASDDVELCLHECRVLIADEIVVAALKVARPLKLLDLTGEFDMVGQTPFEDPRIFARFLSLSRHDDWLDHARTVARAAKKAGLDGVRYVSYYGQAKHQSEALNVALFGRPLEKGDLEITSVNRLRLTDARYAYTFGPVLYQDSEMQAELTRWLNQ